MEIRRACIADLGHAPMAASPYLAVPAVATTAAGSGLGSHRPDRPNTGARSIRPTAN
jgi:hypothetical protein